MFETTYTRPTGGAIDANLHYNSLIVKDPSTALRPCGSSQIATIRVGTNTPDSTPAVKYYLSDHLENGTVVLRTNGSLVNREEFYAFGETSFGSFTYKRYRYNGKEKDEESVLYEYGQRYYAPWLCRFVSVDPIAEDYPQYTSYNYAGNKPISKRDLEGLQEEGAESGGGSGPKNAENSVKDPSNGYLLPEVEVTDIPPSTPETKKGLIWAPVNLSPK